MLGLVLVYPVQEVARGGEVQTRPGGQGGMMDVTQITRECPAHPGEDHAACRIDWPAFGLEPPVRGPGFTCHLCGVYLIRQGCVHEHITEARACSLHLSMLLSYAPPEEWGCARCLPLQVPAPLIVTPSPFGGGS